MAIYQRRDTTVQSWFYQFDFAGKTYKAGAYPSRTAALIAETDRRLEVQSERHKPSQPTALTVREYGEIWMSDHVKPECRPRTADQYRIKLDKYILPRFGHLALTEIGRMDLKKWFAELDGGKQARNTVKNTLIPLRAMLNSALRDGLIGSNPATTLKRSKRARNERDGNEVAAYSQEELESILGAARASESPYSDLYHTLAHSGLRLSEACGLKPLDIASGHLTVRRGAQYAHGRLDIFACKSGQARRVDIPANLEAQLRKREGDWTFSSLTDPVKPLNPTEARDQWRKLLASIGARKLRLHDLRHTYACLLLQKGAPPSYVKEQLGHSSIQVTIDIYGHMIPGANRKWIDQTFGGDNV